MQNRLQITEGEIKKLIQQKIQEAYEGGLDWKTLMNAANKSRDKARDLGYYDEDEQDWIPYNDKDADALSKNTTRMDDFFNSASDSYRNKYGAQHKQDYESYDLCNGKGHNPYEYEQTQTDAWMEDDGTDNEDAWYGVTRTQFTAPEDDFDDYEVDSDYAEDYDSHVFNNPERNFHDTSTKYSKEELSELPPEFRDVHNYKHGLSKFGKQGWSESIAHKITESVIRQLTRK